MASEKIGACTCPLCGGNARLGLAKTQLPVLTCNGCNIQLFARSDRSDGLLRALIRPEKAEPAAPEPPAPAPAKKAAPAPAPTPTPEPAPVRTEKRGPFFF